MKSEKSGIKTYKLNNHNLHRALNCFESQPLIMSTPPPLITINLH